MQQPDEGGREAYALQQAWRAGKYSRDCTFLNLFLTQNLGQNQQPFFNKHGKARVDIERDGAFVQAGDGINSAQVFIPAQKEYVTQKIPLLKRKAAWLVVVLIVVIVGGVVAGVAVHEANKSNRAY